MLELWLSVQHQLMPTIIQSSLPQNNVIVRMLPQSLWVSTMSTNGLIAHTHNFNASEP